MAITFPPYYKKQKKLILILIAALAVGSIIVGVVLTKKTAPLSSLFLEVPKPIEPKINWKVLEDPGLESLQILPEIPPLGEEPGRVNPFLPY